MKGQPSGSAGALIAAAAALRRSFSGSLVSNASIGTLTSLKVGGAAGLLAEPANEDDLLSLAQVLADFQLPCLVLGRGTNVLLSDRGFWGVVIRLGRAFEWIRGEQLTVEAGGATPLPQVANWAARRVLTGMEFAIAIPATVGGAVRMNAGAHRRQVSEVLISARICRTDQRRIDAVPAELLQMDYRRTAIGDRDVVCSATFSLERSDEKAILHRMREHRSHRLATQPADQPNAGSFFKNPAGDSAGGLIDKAGLKGARVGGAEVSEKHANFLVAHPGATAQDVYDLMAVVQSRVLEIAGILLVPEVHVVGSFDDSRGRVRFD